MPTFRAHALPSVVLVPLLIGLFSMGGISPAHAANTDDTPAAQAGAVVLQFLATRSTAELEDIFRLLNQIRMILSPNTGSTTPATNLQVITPTTTPTAQSAAPDPADSIDQSSTEDWITRDSTITGFTVNLTDSKAEVTAKFADGNDNRIDFATTDRDEVISRLATRFNQSRGTIEDMITFRAQ